MHGRVLLGPEPGHVQLFTDDGEMIFETRPPRWPAAQFVVLAALTSSRSSVTAGPRPVKGFDGAPVVYRTRQQAEIEAARLNRKSKSSKVVYWAAP